MSINYNAGGQFCSNILHFTFDDSGFTTTQAAAAGLIAGWDTANRTKLRNMISSHVTILSYRARAIDQVAGFEASLVLSSANTGNRTGNLSVAAVGPCIILFTTGNAPTRGRVFLPSCSDTDVVDGIMTTSYQSVLATNCTAFVSTFSATGGGTPTVQPVVHSRILGGNFNIFAARPSAMIAQVRRRQLPT